MIGKYFLVFSVSLLKFSIAAGLGLGFGFTFWESIVVLGLGGTISVFFFTYAFDFIVKKLFKKENNKSKNDFTKKIAERFGLPGLAMLGPVLLSPPGAIAVALALGISKSEILKWMLGGIYLWTLVFAIFGPSVFELFYSLIS
jgi:hypothetical protein